MKNKDHHLQLPYPQTPESVRAELHARGICLQDWAASLGLPRMAFSDALRGRSMGLRGLSHRAFVALGFKPDPEGKHPRRGKRS